MNITVDNIIAFIRRAIEENLIVYKSDMRDEYGFVIDKENHTMTILFKDNNLEIKSWRKNKNYLFGNITTKFELTERDKVKLDNLSLDIKEYLEKCALDDFNNFFWNSAEKSIYDLDDEED